MGELLGERIAEQIERYIADNDLHQGDKLPSGRELTARYGVSRTVIRDAIGILEQRGLVETRPGSGIFVHDGSSAAVAGVLKLMYRRHTISLPELMEARYLLEVHNAGTAACRPDATAVEALEAAIAKMEAARSPDEFVEADIAFHEALGSAAGNRVLIAFLRSLRRLLHDGMLIGTGVGGARESSLCAHRAIAAAVKAGDSGAARRAMREHLRQTYEEWQRAGYAGADLPLLAE